MSTEVAIDRKTVSIAPRYEVTSDGRVWSTVTHRWMRQFVRRDGYKSVAVRHDGCTLQPSVHRLVAVAWLGVAPDGKNEVNHKNLIKTDNRAVNLEWVSPAENSQHAWRTLPPETIARMLEGRSRGAMVVNRRKRLLSPQQIADIRGRLASGETRDGIAPHFGVSRTTIDNIANGRIYVD